MPLTKSPAKPRHRPTRFPAVLSIRLPQPAASKLCSYAVQHDRAPSAMARTWLVRSIETEISKARRARDEDAGGGGYTVTLETAS